MTDELETTARTLVEAGKGILAIDETNRTCTERFEELGIESTPESRRDYRELLVTTPGASEHVSGVILYDETIRQTASDGQPLVEIICEAGMLPGIKVDKGLSPLAHAPGERVTEGLDGLRERLAEYRELGARFTKWRAVFTIGDGLPSRYCIETNVHAMARYAALVQEAGLAPIVEPEVLMDGGHDAERCGEVTEAVVRALFEQLAAQRCRLEGLVLKTNMVTPGKDSVRRAAPAEVGERTVRTLRRCVPAAVPGIAFLSGGQSGGDACANLDAVARRGPLAWEVTFSFGRALQYPALPTWDGRPERASEAQAAFRHRLRMSAAARDGAYTPEAERAPAR